MPEHRIPPVACPYCDNLLDAASGMGHRQVPKPGDFTVCIYCAQILRFTANMSLGKVSQREVSAQPRELRQGLALVARAIRSLDRR